MRTLTATLLASTMAFMTFTAAQAADAVDQIPEAPMAVEDVAPVGNWGGAYLGGTASYDAGRFHNGGDYNARAFGGGVYGGYNWQSGQIVYGAEGDVNYNGIDGRAAAGIDGKQGINGSIRGRVGYDMNPFLLYGTAGLAASNNKLDDGTSSDKKTALGYTVGAGVEAMVTNNITARVEYRYTDYQKKDFDLDSGRVSRGFDDHSVKVGIGMKF